MSNVVEFPTTEKPITEDEIDKLHTPEHFAIWKVGSPIVCAWRVSQCRWPSTRSRAGTTSTKMQCSRCSRSRLPPLHVLADLFDDGDLPVPNPEAAAEIVIQRLIDSGFEIPGSLAQP
jgi:hypothetical protein